MKHGNMEHYETDNRLETWAWSMEACMKHGNMKHEAWGT
jgi:hypothetical protein